MHTKSVKIVYHLIPTLPLPSFTLLLHEVFVHKNIIKSLIVKSNDSSKTIFWFFDRLQNMEKTEFSKTWSWKIKRISFLYIYRTATLNFQWNITYQIQIHLRLDLVNLDLVNINAIAGAANSCFLFHILLFIQTRFNE